MSEMHNTGFTISLEENCSNNASGVLYLGDAIDFMKKIPDETFDLVIADPPYYRIRGDFDFEFATREEYLLWSRLWLTECRRVIKNTGTLILWNGVGGPEIMMARLAVMIEDSDLFLRQNWVTQRNTRGIGSRKNYMHTREDFLFLTKTEKYTFNVPYSEEPSLRKDLGANGKPRKNKFKRISNVWYDITEASQSSKERCGHPTVKAQKLCRRIIETHSNPGDSLFIPFAGSGSECAAALRSGRSFVAVEKKEEYYHLSVKRICDISGGFADEVC